MPGMFAIAMLIIVAPSWAWQLAWAAAAAAGLAKRPMTANRARMKRIKFRVMASLPGCHLNSSQRWASDLSVGAGSASA
jgi:hypothetical protein